MKKASDGIGVGDLLEHRNPESGIVTQWRVLGIQMGGIKQEPIVELGSVTRTPNEVGALLVPIQLLDTLDIAFVKGLE